MLYSREGPTYLPTYLQVQIWSTGITLQGWVADLRAAGCASMQSVEWEPT